MAETTLPPGAVAVGPGTVITFDVMEWLQPWREFDYPSAILSPVIQVHEDGRNIEGVIEDACVDACIEGYLRHEPVESLGGVPDVVGRRWRLASLRKRFREALAGHEFPVMRYKARRVTVRFYADRQFGDLDWEEVDDAE